MMNLYSRILGCLLGTAVGDAVGLRREGLSSRRAMRLYGGLPLEPSLIFGRGFCSDDTEHTVMVGRALAQSGGNSSGFERLLAQQLKKWLLTAPAGIGLSTLRACIRLVLGFGSKRSGVYSAGNGPAMRSALIGVCATSERQLTEIVAASTRLTHTDPRADEGAHLVARAARLGLEESGIEPIQFLFAAASTATDSELRTILGAAAQALADGKTSSDFAKSQGWSRGISGYVNHTVPAALYCWARWPNDFRRCVEDAVLLGGDTDTVGAIAGGVCGANLGNDAIPRSWIERLAEWPRTVEWMQRLAESLTRSVENNVVVEPPPMRWLLTLPRNLAFSSIVVTLALRRLLPPY
jgi:ADP-ribosyl-[dinitrogen reductase] hydrolase